MTAKIMITLFLGASLMTACSNTSPMGPQQDNGNDGQQELVYENPQLDNEGNSAAKLDHDRWMAENRSVELGGESGQQGEGKVGRSRLFRKGFLLTDTPDEAPIGDGEISGGTVAGAIAKDRYRRGGEFGTDSVGSSDEKAPGKIHRDVPLGPVELPDVIIHPNPGTEESKGSDF